MKDQQPLVLVARQLSVYTRFSRSGEQAWLNFLERSFYPAITPGVFRLPPLAIQGHLIRKMLYSVLNDGILVQ